MRNSGTFLGTLLVSKEYRYARFSLSRRLARSHLTRMELVRTSGSLPLCPRISCEAKDTLPVSASAAKGSSGTRPLGPAACEAKDTLPNQTSAAKGAAVYASGLTSGYFSKKQTAL